MSAIGNNKLIKYFENNPKSFEESNAFDYNSIVYLFNKAILESNDLYNVVRNLIIDSQLSNYGITIIISIDTKWEHLKVSNTYVFKSMKEFIDFINTDENKKKAVVRVIYDKPVDTKHSVFYTAFAWYVNNNCKKTEILNVIENTELKVMDSPINLENTLICEMNNYKVATKCNFCKKFCNVIDIDQIYLTNKSSGNPKFIPATLIDIDSMRKCSKNPETMFIISKQTEYLYKYYIGNKTIQSGSNILKNTHIIDDD